MSIAASERHERDRRAKGKQSARDIEHALRKVAGRHGEDL
jgi:hypothetical protein